MPLPSRSGSIEIAEDDSGVTVRVIGFLDDSVGQQLAEVVETALTLRCRVQLDVDRVSRFTWPGLDALGGCVERGARARPCRPPRPR